MRYMQLIRADDIGRARQAYLGLLVRAGVALPPMTEIFVEGVHRHRPSTDTWLCYYALPGQRQRTA